MQQYILRNLRFAVQSDYNLQRQAAKKLGLRSDAFELTRIIRKAVDTRRHDQPIYDFTVQIGLDSAPPRNKDLAPLTAPSIPEAPAIALQNPHPFIVGMGPAGLFCALAMVQNGLQPWLFDRGDALAERATVVEKFWQQGVLDEESNVQFGEGGAGTFSDGKLTHRSSDIATDAVIGQMLRFGANPEIRYEALPHLGTEGIRALVNRIREYLLEAGCRFFYRSKLEDITLEDGKVSSVRINNELHQPEVLILGLGNSSRETFRMLHSRGIELQAKPFALGMRIEQPQQNIDRCVYGSERWASILGPASYRLTAPTGFTFCMCPGGKVIASSTQSGGIVTNGMSFAARGSGFANSAVVTPVTEKDYGTGLWAGMELQRALEKASFREGYLAPAQSVEDFLKSRVGNAKALSSYLPGCVNKDLSQLYSPEISLRLREALHRFEQVLPGFLDDAMLIAPETRTSSPIRILRHSESLFSTSASNLYPIGEGSGYAGGIVSSAVDGWRLGQRLAFRG